MNLRHSKGLRCPRNQPLQWWEILQQSLKNVKRLPKVSQWTKPGYIDWSPGHNSQSHWPHYVQQLAMQHNNKPSNIQQKHNLQNIYPNIFQTRQLEMKDQISDFMVDLSQNGKKDHLSSGKNGTLLRNNNSKISYQINSTTEPEINITHSQLPYYHRSQRHHSKHRLTDRARIHNPSIHFQRKGHEKLDRINSERFQGSLLQYDQTESPFPTWKQSHTQQNELSSIFSDYETDKELEYILE